MHFFIQISIVQVEMLARGDNRRDRKFAWRCEVGERNPAIPAIRSELPANGVKVEASRTVARHPAM